MWIHTFVPGLPLSFLNHGLVWGNALTGVGTIDEITSALADAGKRETKSSGNTDSVLLEMALADFMDRAGAQLDRLGRLADASIADVQAASDAQAEIETALAPLAALCDLITAERTTRQVKKGDPEKILLSAGNGRLFTASDADSLEGAVLTHPDIDRAREIADRVQAAHIPVCFPEVMRRDRPGFDVILGNPPWEKLKVEEHGWWAIRFPGLRSMPQQEKNAAITAFRAERPDLVAQFTVDVAAAQAASSVLIAGPFPGIGATDVDLFAAFCWRFWHQCRSGGRVGVVLPRAAMSGAGTGEWRKAVLAGGAIPDLTTLVNNRGWAFEQIHPQYTIALLTLAKGGIERTVRLRGPFASMEDFVAGVMDSESVAIVASSTVLGWSESGAIPLIPARDVEVFTALRRHPRLDSSVGDWVFRPYVELHTTKDKALYDFNLAEPASGYTVPVWTGGTFNLWAPGSGAPYAFANPETLLPVLLEKRANSSRSSASPFHDMPQSWLDDPTTLPFNRPRIAFRDVCRATDSRTMICALVPPGRALVHKAPYLLRKRGDERDEAYVLGVLSSMVFDWASRRSVELAMTYEILNSLPVPRVSSDTGQRIDATGAAMDTADMRQVRDRVVEIAGSLAARDESFRGWAAAVGVPLGSVKTDGEMTDLVAELDALVALLYGLTANQVAKVFSSFHRGWDYQPRLDAVLVHYRAWLERLDGKGLLS